MVAAGVRAQFGLRPQVLAVAVAAAALVVMFESTFAVLYSNWQREEYSHGFLIPLVSGFLLWQRRAQFAQLTPRGSWTGVALAVLGLAIYFVGSLASITTVDTYALVIVIAGCVLALMGWQAFKLAAVPIALLFLMNPIPAFFYNNLSLQLQLISSELGVGLMRLFGVSVFLEGNVIDLGAYKLEVAEACSGLRYLFPLMTLGVICAYLFKGRAWMRWCLFLSTVPITVLMNSLRIGVIGLLVDRFGIAQAQGFLHWFEGWVVFMLCFLLLLAEAWLLLWLSGSPHGMRDLFALEAVPAAPGPSGSRGRALGGPAALVLAILLLAVVPARALPKRVEVSPARADFVEFPLQIGSWRGRRERLETVYIDTLRMDDYVLANFVREPAAGESVGGAELTQALVNLYVVYYASQRTGQSAHSPRACLPGGGWRIAEFGQQEVPGVSNNGAPLRVNRAIVQQGAERELVYYWFQERGRDITSEYLVKWYLLEDALMRNRTDGALVRLVTPLGGDEHVAAADARLAGFAAGMMPILQSYLPN